MLNSTAAWAAGLRRIRMPALLRNGVWVLAGQVGNSLALLLSIRILTESLSPDAFGRLTLLLGVSALILGLSITPPLQALARYFPDWKQQSGSHALRRQMMRLLSVRIGMACGLLVIAAYVAAPLLSEGRTIGLLLALLLIVDSLRSFELVMFNSARRQSAQSMLLIADTWCRLGVAALAMMFAEATPELVIGAYLLASAAVLLCVYIARVGEGASASPVPSSTGGLDLSGFAARIRAYELPLVPLALFGWLSGMGDRYLLGGLAGFAVAGLYAAAYALASRPFLMLSTIIELTMRPVLHDAISAGRLSEVDRAGRIWLLLVLAGSSLGVLAFLVASPLVSRLVLATEYQQAAELMPWLALGYALQALSTAFTRFCYAFEDTKAVLHLTMIGSVAGLAVMVPAVMVAGLIGAAIAVPVRFAIELMFAIHFSRKAHRRALGLDASLNKHGL